MKPHKLKNLACQVARCTYTYIYMGYIYNYHLVKIIFVVFVDSCCEIRFFCQTLPPPIHPYYKLAICINVCVLVMDFCIVACFLALSFLIYFLRKNQTMQSSTTTHAGYTAAMTEKDAATTASNNTVQFPLQANAVAFLPSNASEVWIAIDKRPLHKSNLNKYLHAIADTALPVSGYQNYSAKRGCGGKNNWSNQSKFTQKSVQMESTACGPVDLSFLLVNIDIEGMSVPLRMVPVLTGHSKIVGQKTIQGHISSNGKTKIMMHYSAGQKRKLKFLELILRRCTPEVLHQWSESLVNAVDKVDEIKTSFTTAAEYFAREGGSGSSKHMKIPDKTKQIITIDDDQSIAPAVATVVPLAYKSLFPQWLQDHHQAMHVSRVQTKQPIQNKKGKSLSTGSSGDTVAGCNNNNLIQKLKSTRRYKEQKIIVDSTWLECIEESHPVIKGKLNKIIESYYDEHGSNLSVIDLHVYTLPLTTFSLAWNQQEKLNLSSAGERIGEFMLPSKMHPSLNGIQLFVQDLRRVVEVHELIHTRDRETKIINNESSSLCNRHRIPMQISQKYSLRNDLQHDSKREVVDFFTKHNSLYTLSLSDLPSSSPSSSSHAHHHVTSSLKTCTTAAATQAQQQQSPQSPQSPQSITAMNSLTLDFLVRTGFLILPTGEGKTIISLHIIADLYKRGYIHNAVIVCSYIDAIEQFLDRAKSSIDGYDEAKPNDDDKKNVMIVNTAAKSSAYKNAKLREINEWSMNNPDKHRLHIIGATIQSMTYKVDSAESITNPANNTTLFTPPALAASTSTPAAVSSLSSKAPSVKKKVKTSSNNDNQDFTVSENGVKIIDIKMEDDDEDENDGVGEDKNEVVTVAVTNSDNNITIKKRKIVVLDDDNSSDADDHQKGNTTTTTTKSSSKRKRRDAKNPAAASENSASTSTSSASGASVVGVGDVDAIPNREEDLDDSIGFTGLNKKFEVLKRYMCQCGQPDCKTIVIVDESQIIAAVTYRWIISRVFPHNVVSFWLGLTASLQRADEKMPVSINLLGHPIKHVTVLELRRQLRRFVKVLVKYSVPDMYEVSKRESTFDQLTSIKEKLIYHSAEDADEMDDVDNDLDNDKDCHKAGKSKTKKNTEMNKKESLINSGPLSRVNEFSMLMDAAEQQQHQQELQHVNNTLTNPHEQFHDIMAVPSLSSLITNPQQSTPLSNVVVPESIVVSMPSTMSLKAMNVSQFRKNMVANSRARAEFVWLKCTHEYMHERYGCNNILILVDSVPHLIMLVAAFNAIVNCGRAQCYSKIGYHTSGGTTTTGSAVSKKKRKTLLLEKTSLTTSTSASTSTSLSTSSSCCSIYEKFAASVRIEKVLVGSSNVSKIPKVTDKQNKEGYGGVTVWIGTYQKAGAYYDNPAIDGLILNDPPMCKVQNPGRLRDTVKGTMMRVCDTHDVAMKRKAFAFDPKTLFTRIVQSETIDDEMNVRDHVALEDYY